MAVLETCEIWRGRTGNWDQEGKRSFVRRFRVHTSSQFDGALTVMMASGLPLLGSVYADANGTVIDAGSRLKNFKPSQSEDDPRVWEIDANYDSETEKNEQDSQQPGESGGGGDNGNPLDDLPEWTLDFEEGMRVVEEWYETVVGVDPVLKPVCNSAGDAFDPPIEIPESYPVLTYKRNEGPQSITRVINYQNAVNSDFLQFVDLTLSPGTVRVRGINIVGPKRRNDVLYNEVTYQFVLKRDKWNPLRILDQGLRFRDGNDLKDVLIEDEDGNRRPVSAPVLLDGAGGVLAPNPFNQELIAQYIEVRPYKSLPFSVLGIFS